MENSMLKVGGQHFRCACGANVFHKGVKPGLWICNGCGTEYADETYDHRKSNADRLRAKSDEELAEQLVVAVNGLQPCTLYYSIPTERTFLTEAEAVRVTLEYLQQPAEEES